jgi:hypothetical protein
VLKHVGVMKIVIFCISKVHLRMAKCAETCRCNENCNILYIESTFVWYYKGFNQNARNKQCQARHLFPVVSVAVQSVFVV